MFSHSHPWLPLWIGFWKQNVSGAFCLLCHLFLSIARVFKLPIRGDVWVARTQDFHKALVLSCMLSNQTDFLIVPWITTRIYLPLYICPSNLPSSTSSSFLSLFVPFGGWREGGGKQCWKRQQCLKLGWPGCELIPNVESSSWNMVAPRWIFVHGGFG